MAEGTFRKVEKTEEQMFGPRGLVVCGYPPEEHSPVSQFAAKLGGSDLPVLFASDDVAGKTLKEILALPNGHGQGKTSRLRRSMILSGFTQNELHALMSAYKKAGLPRQLWATLTPVSENWTLEALLEELAKEAESLK
jgi:hypothetical protein